MEGGARDEIRRLLKTFGIQADEVIVTHLARMPEVDSLQLSLRLEDKTDYGDRPPAQPLRLEVEGSIHRRP